LARFRWAGRSATDDDPFTFLKVFELGVVFAVSQPPVNCPAVHFQLAHQDPTFLQAEHEIEVVDLETVASRIHERQPVVRVPSHPKKSDSAVFLTFGILKAEDRVMAKVNLYTLVCAPLHRQAGFAAQLANSIEVVAHGSRSRLGPVLIQMPEVL
jgi:hypothetical protein